jgi:hypothetical protein
MCSVSSVESQSSLSDRTVIQDKIPYKHSLTFVGAGVPPGIYGGPPPPGPLSAPGKPPPSAPSMSPPSSYPGSGSPPSKSTPPPIAPSSPPVVEHVPPPGSTPSGAYLLLSQKYKIISGIRGPSTNAPNLSQVQSNS